MPHLIVEYSANITDNVKRTKLLNHAHNAMLDCGVFTVAADVKSRAYAADDFAVGEAGTAQSFIHARIYLLEGRTPEQKAAAVDAVFAALQTHGAYASQISVDIRDMGRDTYCKRVAT